MAADLRMGSHVPWVTWVGAAGGGHMCASTVTRTARVGATPRTHLPGHSSNHAASSHRCHPANQHLFALAADQSNRHVQIQLDDIVREHGWPALGLLLGCARLHDMSATHLLPPPAFHTCGRPVNVDLYYNRVIEAVFSGQKVLKQRQEKESLIFTARCNFLFFFNLEKWSNSCLSQYHFSF